MLVGGIAAEGTMWKNFWAVVESGGWTVFNQIELLFVIGLPMGLAQKANARAALESFVVYKTFNNFLSKILQLMGPTFNVDFTQEVGGNSGLKMIAGTKTLDTNLIGAILIAAIVVWIHNRYFEKKLPDYSVQEVDSKNGCTGCVGIIINSLESFIRGLGSLYIVVQPFCTQT